MPTNDPASEVPLHAMTRKPCINVIVDLHQSGPLMMLSTFKYPPRGIVSGKALKRDRKVWLFFQCNDVDSVDKVTSVQKSLWSVYRLIGIGFSSEVPSVTGGINDTSCGASNTTSDIVTS